MIIRIIPLLLFIGLAWGQIDIIWTRTFDNYTDNDEARSLKPTNDGGHIITGKSILIKADYDGSEEWSNSSINENGDSYFVQQTNDGGYIITGSIPSGGWNLFLSKTDSEGNEEWNRTFGENSMEEHGRCVVQTSDGGYAIIGQDHEQVNSTTVIYHLWLIKTDSEGNEEWNRTFGDYAFGNYLLQTSDGGFILTGYTNDNNWDIWLIKTDSEGNEEWNHIYDSDNGSDSGHSIYQTNDGGFIIAGIQGSQTPDEYSSGWLIKTDSEGNEEWNQVINSSIAYDVKGTLDGGYIIVGHHHYLNDELSGTRIIKTDSEGNEEYSQTFDGSQNDGFLYETHQINAQHYITAGKLDGDALLMKFIIPWCPIELWTAFVYSNIQQMITGDMATDMVYDINYDGNLDVMDMLIAADVMDESIDTPYDCRE